MLRLSCLADTVNFYKQAAFSACHPASCLSPVKTSLSLNKKISRDLLVAASSSHRGQEVGRQPSKETAKVESWSEVGSRDSVERNIDQKDLSAGGPMGEEGRVHLRRLLAGEVDCVLFSEGSVLSSKGPLPEGESKGQGGRRFILPGSFNPLHKGHLGLMEAALRTRSLSTTHPFGWFEIAAVNADKPPLEAEDILWRVGQFRERGLTTVVTRTPLFFQKALLFPHSTFIIGFDTAVRLLNPQYYGGSEHEMIKVLIKIQETGCDFLVAGRTVNGSFRGFDDVKVPLQIAKMVHGIAEDSFRIDISSTELRAKLRAPK